MRYRVHVVPRLRRPGGLLIPHWLAITLGGHIWSWRPLEGPELAHEVTHVRQWAQHGWRYPLLYALASLRARRSGGHWYRDNRFEREAREAAAKVAASTSPAQT